MPSGTKTLEEECNETYHERTDLFMLAMTFAKMLGYKVGWREQGEKYTVLNIMMSDDKEIAIHARNEEILDEITKLPGADPWDGSFSADKRIRIHEFIKSNLSTTGN